MKLIVCLGNPGRKYEQTRHNVGFVTAAKLAAKLGASKPRVKFEGETAEAMIPVRSVSGEESDAAMSGPEKLLILCPTTYMNASGQSVRKAFDFYNLSLDDLLVICDDMDLPTGRLRIRPSGSAGGQKGVADIIRHLNSNAFTRLRIGIDRPPGGWDVKDYVLSKFSDVEKETIEQATTRAAEAAMDWATCGTVFAANRYNPESKI